MGKYPAINYNLISKCIKKINAVEFDTYDFINVVEIIDRDFIKLFSGIGIGWKKVIGRQLSKYSTNTNDIKKMKKRKGYAQCWLKS